MTATQYLEFACRATVVICAAFILSFMIEFFVSDREVADE